MKTNIKNKKAALLADAEHADVHFNTQGIGACILLGCNNSGRWTGGGYKRVLLPAFSMKANRISNVKIECEKGLHICQKTIDKKLTRRIRFLFHEFVSEFAEEDFFSGSPRYGKGSVPPCSAYCRTAAIIEQQAKRHLLLL